MTSIAVLLDCQMPNVLMRRPNAFVSIASIAVIYVHAFMLANIHNVILLHNFRLESHKLCKSGSLMSFNHNKTIIISITAFKALDVRDATYGTAVRVLFSISHGCGSNGGQTSKRDKFTHIKNVIY